MIAMEFGRPLNLTAFSIPPEKVEVMLTRMTEGRNSKREIYGRIRIHVIDAKAPEAKSGRIRGVLKGDVTAIDFFLDKEMTKPIGGTQKIK